MSDVSVCHTFRILSSSLYYHIMHTLHIEQAATHPAAVMMLPPMTIIYIASVLPLFMFLSYQKDYRGPNGAILNPLVPSDYLLVVQKSFKAMKDNNFKVSEKNL